MCKFRTQKCGFAFPFLFFFPFFLIQSRLLSLQGKESMKNLEIQSRLLSLQGKESEKNLENQTKDLIITLFLPIEFVFWK